MSPRLETTDDQLAERRVIHRLTHADNGLTDYVKFPPYSACDYAAVTRNGRRVLSLVEVKTRKSSPEDIKPHGGLLIKQRKVEEMLQLSSLLSCPAYIVFGFQNGAGQLMSVDVRQLHGHQPVYTGRRDRDLACDEEPVFLLNWPDDPHPDLKDITS